MKNNEIKSIHVKFIESLDDMEMEEVSEFLEHDVEKYNVGCRNWIEDYPYQPITIFTMAYSKKYLYVDFFVRGNFLRAMNYENNSPVSEDSCVEFFLSTPGSKEYWNFEFNCIGTLNASHREKRENPIRLTDEQIASVKRYASCGTRPFQEMEGLFGWNLTIAIPFELIGIDYKNIPLTLRGNLYKCGSKTSMPHYLSWAPIDTKSPDFHRPEFFGEIILD